MKLALYLILCFLIPALSVYIGAIVIMNKPRPRYDWHDDHHDDHGHGGHGHDDHGHHH